MAHLPGLRRTWFTSLYQGYGGEDSFTFIVSDGELISDAAVVSITINHTVFFPLISR